MLKWLKKNFGGQHTRSASRGDDSERAVADRGLRYQRRVVSSSSSGPRMFPVQIPTHTSLGVADLRVTYPEKRDARKAALLKQFRSRLGSLTVDPYIAHYFKYTYEILHNNPAEKVEDASVMLSDHLPVKVDFDIFHGSSESFRITGYTWNVLKLASGGQVFLSGFYTPETESQYLARRRLQVGRIVNKLNGACDFFFLQEADETLAGMLEARGMTVLRPSPHVFDDTGYGKLFGRGLYIVSKRGDILEPSADFVRGFRQLEFFTEGSRFEKREACNYFQPVICRSQPRVVFFNVHIPFTMFSNSGGIQVDCGEGSKGEHIAHAIKVLKAYCESKSLLFGGMLGDFNMHKITKSSFDDSYLLEFLGDGYSVPRAGLTSISHNTHMGMPEMLSYNECDYPVVFIAEEVGSLRGVKAAVKIDYELGAIIRNSWQLAQLQALMCPAYVADSRAAELEAALENEAIEYARSYVLPCAQQGSYGKFNFGPLSHEPATSVRDVVIYCHVEISYCDDVFRMDFQFPCVFMQVAFWKITDMFDLCLFSTPSYNNYLTICFGRDSLVDGMRSIFGALQNAKALASTLEESPKLNDAFGTLHELFAEVIRGLPLPVMDGLAATRIGAYDEGGTPQPSTCR